MFENKAEFIRTIITPPNRAPRFFIFGILAIFCLIGFIAAFMSWTGRDPYNPNGLIRLHVIANSDSPADQALKYKVRDAIVKEMGPLFSEAKDLKEARTVAEKNLPGLQKVAENVINKAGSKNPVQVMLGNYNFPVKSYRNLTLPAGRYEAVRVIIGKGEGKNWWCVLFPPLCFVDVRQVSEPEAVSTTTPQPNSGTAAVAGYSAGGGEEVKDPEIQVRFKLLDLIKGIF